MNGSREPSGQPDGLLPPHNLVLQAIPIVTEAAWNEEGRSFCFRDPDNNLLEIANADFWPR